MSGEGDGDPSDRQVRVFVVDNLAGIHTAVAQLDCQVVAVAFSAEEAIDIAPTVEFDVAVVDYLLPGGMRGVELAEHLKAIRPQAPVILLSALPVEDQAEHSEHVDHFVDKVAIEDLDDLFSRIGPGRS